MESQDLTKTAARSNNKA